MHPKEEKLIPKIFHLRLDLQECQDVINGVEALMDELDNEKDQKELELTKTDLIYQLSRQGITPQQISEPAASPQTGDFDETNQSRK
jgi:hypothetical protein